MAVLENCEPKNVFHYFEEIRHFFQVYKTLENDKVTTVTEINGCDDAKEVIRKSIDSYIRDFQMA